MRWFRQLLEGDESPHSASDPHDLGDEDLYEVWGPPPPPAPIDPMAETQELPVPPSLDVVAYRVEQMLHRLPVG